MIAKTSAAAAGQYAGNITIQLNGLSRLAQQVQTDGIPAQPQVGNPAVTAAELQAALGTQTVAVLAVAAAAVAQADPTKLANALAALA